MQEQDGSRIENLILEDTEQYRLCQNCSYNLEHIHECKRCGQEFCPHYSSKVDFQFCIYCLHDFYMEDSIIRKVIESKSLDGKKTFTRVMRARLIMFKGQDWMFAQARVNTLSDEELGTTIEYHRAIFGELINEMEARKIAKNKLALNKMMKASTLKIPGVNGFYTDGTPMPVDTIGTDHTVVTTTTVKRTKISATQTNSASVAITALLNMFKAQGLTQEQAVAKLQSMAAGAK